jgi:hypothetical protein
MLQKIEFVFCPSCFSILFILTKHAISHLPSLRKETMAVYSSLRENNTALSLPTMEGLED